MSYLIIFGVFLLGLLIGIGITMLYIQYSVYSQMGQMEEQMESLMNMDDLEFPEMEDENKKEDEDGS